MDRSLTAFPGLVRAQDSLVMRVAFVVGVVLSVTAAAAAAGAALAFSSFIVPALHGLPAHEAVQAKQHITLSVMPPAFWLVLVGTAVYATKLVVVDVITRGWRASPWLVLGAVFYVVGVVGVTLFGTMPLEAWLAGLDSSALPVDAWISYATAWAGFNNVRLLAALFASLFFVVAMVRR